MRLIFINRFYWPDEPATGQLLTDLAEGLAARGWPVTVIASRPRGAPRFEDRHGVHVLRVNAPRRSRRLLARALDHLVFSLGAIAELSGVVAADDIVIFLTDPPLLALPGGWLARRRGARVVHWVQDIFPEVAAAVTGTSLALRLRAPRDRAWRRSDRCVALGLDMAALLRRAGLASRRIAVIPNWAPRELAPAPDDAVVAQRAAWHLKGKFVLGYSGNLGRVHELAPLLALAARLRDDDRFVLLFVGDGAQRAALARAARADGLTNIRFHPPQARARLAVALAVADLHFVTLKPGCEALVFPSKLYGIAAVGRPVLFVGPLQSEIARLVTQFDLGYAFAPDDTTGLARAVRALAELPAERAALRAGAQRFAQRFSPERALDAWSALLRELASSP